MGDLPEVPWSVCYTVHGRGIPRMCVAVDHDVDPFVVTVVRLVSINGRGYHRLWIAPSPRGNDHIRRA